MRPGSDDYITEKYAIEIEAILRQWGEDLRSSRRQTCRTGQGRRPFHSGFRADSGEGIQSALGLRNRRRPAGVWSGLVSGRDRFLEGVSHGWPISRALKPRNSKSSASAQSGSAPLTVVAEIRYDLVGERSANEQPRRTRRILDAPNGRATNRGTWTAHKWAAAKRRSAGPTARSSSI